MIRGFLTILILIAAVGLKGQSLVTDLIDSYPSQASTPELESLLEHHIQKLLKLQLKSKTQSDFVEKTFYYLHQRVFKSYVPYSQFNELLETGSYDCLSATALFAVIFERFNVPVTIKETNYHIFLTVESENESILIETTDGTNGFVKNRKEIEARLELYQQNVLANLTQNHYLYQAQIFQPITSSQLVGLLYFNQAVREYNKKNLWGCAKSLDESITRYANPRTEELAVILFHSASSSKLDESQKQELLSRYQKYLKRVNPVLAAR